MGVRSTAANSVKRFVNPTCEHLRSEHMYGCEVKMFISELACNHIFNDRHYLVLS
jgi:hypothetical protein